MPALLLICVLCLACALPSLSADTPASYVVESQNLNAHVPKLDGQWQGIRLASDGNCYFGSSTHAHDQGAAFFRYEPAAGKLTMLAEDLSRICGEKPPKDVPQGKLHSDIVEHAGWLYFATHLGLYTPEGKSRYPGSHVLGFELATGKFRDFGVIDPGYSCYSGIAVDPPRNQLYVFLTSFHPGAATNASSRLYRIDLATGSRKNLGDLLPGGPHSCFWLFVDSGGNCWFTLDQDRGSLYQFNARTEKMERFRDVLPEKSSDRWWHWAQPLPGRDKLLFTLFDGDGLWAFDPRLWSSNRSQAFTRIAEIGYSYLGLAVAGDRVYYVQRENKKKGHQDAKDHHLLSVSLTPPFRIVDHGLITDKEGRLANRIPALAADDRGNVYMVGDWYVRPGEKGSYRHSRGNVYHYLERGQFFAWGKVPLGDD